jgi:hypothetical protein
MSPIHTLPYFFYYPLEYRRFIHTYNFQIVSCIPDFESQFVMQFCIAYLC